MELPRHEPPPGCGHELFAETARRLPGGLAAVSESGSITYGELERRSNQLAHRLRRQGLGPDRLVVLCLERSLDMLVGVLGVLKAGGAYVPVDPALPRARIGLVLEQARASVIITQQRLVERLPASPGTVLVLDVEQEQLAREEPGAPADEADPESLAYVIFTSGSTGRPKGVAMPHRPLRNLIAWQLQQSQLGEGSRTLQFSSLSFDVSFQELFSTWAAGGTLVLITEEQRRDPARLLRVLQEQRVERLFLPFIALQQLANVAEGRDLAGLALREVITAGEALQITPPIASLFSRLAGCRLHNQYGPSETHVVTAHWLEGAPSTWPALPPIGRVLPSTGIHLLNDRLQPVAPGEVGELYVAGVALARGYLEQPQLTAERFLPDPFSPEPGGRLYRTGDLARWLPEGSLEFLGRADHQVKIRGFRVELGEVESALATHPLVREAAVVARSEQGGPKYLVAYVVPRSAPLPLAELRAFARRELPEYMVPAAFVVLEALPLTATGKVDRLSLPAPERSRRELLGPYVAPRTELEQRLVALFSEVLGLEQVGCQDDFLELGGNSLHAVALLARVSSAFGVELPVRALFEGRTPAALAGLLEQAQASAQPAPPLTRRDRPGPLLPLSYSQQQLWLLHQVDPQRADYNVPVLLRLEGPLEPIALEQALGDLLRRHEALRTVFPLQGGEPRQQVLESPPLSLRRVELAEPGEEQLRRAAREEALRPFNLEQGPLLRCTLFQLAEHRHALLLVIHHIATDGWSLELMARELAASYRARLGGVPALLPELPLQYADFALWQREWLRGEVLERQVAYWREQLAGAPAALELLTDRPRALTRSLRGASHSFFIESALCARLQALGTREGATLFTTLLAAFQVLLHRYSGQGDILVGCPMASRGRVELEGLLGFFVNMLVMRGRLSPEQGFREALVRTREVTLGAYLHHELPFTRLVELLQPPQEPGRSPLFQVAFALETEQPGWSLPGLSVSAQELDLGTAPFELNLTLVLQPEGGLRGTLTYDTDLFEASTARRMAGHLCTLLASVAEDPSQRISRLPLMDEQERRRVLVEWNDTRAGRGEGCVHEVFSAQAARTPEAVALVYQGHAVSYAELERRSNRLAHRLQALGVGAEVLVAVCVERSVELVVALLGVLKAGGAYVPLDPAYPRQRLEWMLEDSRASVLLTQRHLAERLPSGGARVLELETPGLLEEGPEYAPTCKVLPEHLAHVIYTSGSTGRPKGVAVTHRGVLRLAQARYLPVDGAETFMQFAAISFDASTLEIWCSLLNGARLAIFPPGLPSIEELARFVEEQGVTTLFLTTGLFHQLVEVPPERLRRVRRLLTGGDVLSVAQAQALRERLPGCQLWNLYGPTECTCVATAHPLTGPLGASAPVGRPISDTRVYLLDEGLRPVAQGLVGEIYLGGEGLARGYLGRPELTAERFVPDPCGADPGERLYRTGDLGRYREDGSLEFLGRADQQVKIRGFRVEVGEVEVALGRHPEVRQVVVVARQEVGGGRRLVAYVAASSGLQVESLREHLRRELPEHLIPSAFVVLEALPLTPNGKVDRKALPEPRLEADTGVEAPRTPTEQVVAALFAQVLGVERVGREESFFALGGHSLLATRLVSRLRSTFGVEVRLQILFQSPTVAALAREVERARGRGREVGLRGRGPQARAEGVELSYEQQGLWFLQRLEPGNPFYNVPSVLVLEGELEVEALAGALEELVERHEALRLRFGEREERPMQWVEPPGRLRLRVEELPGAEEPRVWERAREEARTPFALEQGEVARAVLLRLEPRRHVLLFTVHHLVADGWSMEVLFRDWGRLYAARLRGEPAGLPAPGVQYVDYALWQREWLRGEVLEEQLAYWRERLKGAPEALELPTDRPRPAVQTYRGARVNVALPAQLMARARRLAHEEGSTVFMVLLAGLQVLLQRLSGQEDVVVGSPAANRVRGELEGVVGYFANSLVLRTWLGGEPSFREVLRRVREVTLGAYGHQELPFERLVEELRPARDLSRAPLFQVMLVLHEAAAWGLELERVRVRRVDVDPGVSKFDLLLFLLESPERVEGFLEYSTELYEEATARRLVEYFTRLLEAACARPDERTWRLPLLSEQERRRVLVEWNDTRGPRGEACVHEVFAAQAARTPEAVALVYEGRQLSYAELNQQVNRLAHKLRALGVGPEVLVGVYAERSVELVVALLGVLKAGGAYVPLDPGYPRQRLEWMLEETCSPVLLTQRHLAGSLPSTTAKVLELDEPELLLQGPAHEPPPLAGPDNLAYVIYTSGSTGRPKGVAVHHRGVHNRLEWAQETYQLTPEDRVLQKTPFSFDVSVWEFFWTLWVGARLVVARPGGHQDANYLVDCIEREGITMLHFVPSMLEVFLESPELERCRGLRKVLCSGEALPGSLRQRFFARLSAELHNLYGPTEASVDVSAWACERSDTRGFVPIGRPIRNIRLYVLDKHLQPVAPGMTGGLYIGGVGVARGYLGRPELTAERFIPDPYSDEPGARLYYTGDLARWLPDGSIDFLGRVDHQVKIRGLRIELGEIEAALRRHPHVREALVLAREDRPGNRRLVAYVTASGEQPPAAEVLRPHLLSSLPDYMVPSAFVVLPALPLSPNGKVDRKALPAPELPESSEEDSTPLSPKEQILADIWCQVLGLSRVGRHDDFFALGGDSILSLRIVLRAQKAGLALTVKQLFQHPTIAALAAQAGTVASPPPGGDSELPGSAEPANEAFPLSKLSSKGLRSVLSRFQATKAGEK